MASKIWFTSKDDNIEYISLSKKYIDGSLEVLQTSFFQQESICIVCGIPNDPIGRKDLERLCLEVVEDGVSIVAIDKHINKVVGAAFNKLHLNDGNVPFYENFARTCKSTSSRDLILFMNDTDSKINFFDIGKTNCIFEVMFLTVLPTYERKKIGSKLVQISLQVAEQLSKLKGIRQPLRGVLSSTPRPGIVTALPTSNISQRIFEKLNFKTAAEIPYRDLKRNKTTFYDLLEGKQEKLLVVYKIL